MFAFRLIKRLCARKHILGLWLLFLLPFLACDASREIPPTLLAPHDLSGTDLSFTDHLSGYDFSGKNLRNVNFTQAVLRNANFRNADLTGAILDSAILQGADFTNATLDEKWALIIDLLTSGEGEGQDFSEYDMRAAYLSGSDLENASLQGVDLSNAILSRANLKGANLGNANLREANLGGANLRNANLTGANLGLTSLYGADLTGAIVTEEQLRRVGNLECTRLPDGTVVNLRPYCTPPTPPPQ